MGLFDGLFDFNHDGKTDIAEQFLAFNLFAECTHEEDDDDSYGIDDEIEDDAY